jgi:HlyD family secretion protein
MPPKSSKIKLIVAALIILAALFIFVFKPFGQNGEGNLYRTQRVINSQLRIAVSATGTLNPVMVVNVGTQISGTIKEIMVDFNDEVKEGQLLLSLDDQLFRAKADMAKANLMSSEAQRDLAKLKYERQKRLFEAKSAPQEELDTAEANLRISEAQVAQHRASLAQDLYNLNNTKVISPVDGVVINRGVDVGQTVASSFQTPTLIDIAQDLSKMQINASFAEADIGRLAPNLSATFGVDAYPGQLFTGIVRQIRLNPTITSNVVTYDVVVDVENEDLLLLPGMTAYVDIELYREDDVLLVPNAALNFRLGQSDSGNGGLGDTSSLVMPDVPADGAFPEQTGSVYVLGQDLKPREVKLTLGATDLRYTVVKSGNLSAGDSVIIGQNAPQSPNSIIPGGGSRQTGGMPRRF